MTTREGSSFREQLRLLVRSLGILEKSDGPGGPVTITQCHALVEVGRRESISLIDLANLLRVDKSTMSRTISHLDRAGFVMRDTDPKNRRYIAIRLTAAGQKAFEDIERRSGGYYQSVFDLIPAAKQSQVLESLALVTKALREMDGDE